MPPKKKKEPEKAPVEEAFQTVDVSTREPRTVVLMLDSPEQAVVCKACQALHKHMEKSEQNCLDMKELGIIPRLIRILSEPEKAVRAYAILCLSVMAQIASIRKILHASNCFPPLLSLLNPAEEEVTRERAASVLAHLATEYTSKTELLRLEAHRPLLQLLQVAEPDTQRHCLTALGRLAELHHSRAAIAEAGGLPPLLGLLDSEYPPIQQLTLQILHSCMHDVDCRSVFRDSDGLTKIVAFIGNKDYGDLHVQAISILSLCLHDTENMATLQSSGTLQLLLEHIAGSSDAAMKRSATQALAKAAMNDVNQKILHEQKVEKTLIQLLSSDDAGLLTAALEGLSAMCALSSSRQVIGQWGGVEGMVKCGRSDDGRVRSAAAQALANVSTESPANCKLIQDGGGCSVLVQLLSDSEAASRSGAATTVTHLAVSEAVREELLAAGAVPALVGCLGFQDSGVQTPAAEAMAMMASDGMARTQLLSGGGVPALLPLLRSSDQRLVEAALWTVRATAQSSAVAEELCQKGALQLLTQLSRSGSAPSSCGPALQQLLDSNLSAKWWVLGRLEPSDVLRDCKFFDAGQALSSSSPFTPLSVLLSQPLHMNRPVLTANLLARPAPPPPAEDTPTTQPLEASQSQSRAKSRMNSKSRKGRDAESRVSESSTEEQQAAPAGDGEAAAVAGQLPVDPGLWEHIHHTHSHITPLTTTREQVEALASYVCQSLGGPVGHPGNMLYELSSSEAQRRAGSNVVPLGEVAMGTYQHRALLFKVLADQLGLSCSLVRGDYGRHWNVVVMGTDRPHGYVINLMSDSEHLLPAGSPQAHQYQHL